jgi:hypothetical protein
MGWLKLYHRRPHRGSHADKGAEEGDARPRRGWPPSAVAAISPLTCDSNATAVTTAPQPTEGADVDADRAEPARAAVYAAR